MSPEEKEKYYPIVIRKFKGEMILTLLFKIVFGYLEKLTIFTGCSTLHLCYFVE